MNSELQLAIDKARPMVKSLLRRFPEHMADDVLADAIFKAHIKGHTFRDEAKFSTWFYAVARNEALQWIRKNKHQFVSTEVLANVPTREVSPEAQAVEAQRRRILLEEVARLPRKCREIVREVLAGNQVGLNNTRKARMHRARRDLRSALRERGVR